MLYQHCRVMGPGIGVPTGLVEPRLARRVGLRSVEEQGPQISRIPVEVVGFTGSCQQGAAFGGGHGLQISHGCVEVRGNLLDQDQKAFGEPCCTFCGECGFLVPDHDVGVVPELFDGYGEPTGEVNLVGMCGREDALGKLGVGVVDEADVEQPCTR